MKLTTEQLKQVQAFLLFDNDDPATVAKTLLQLRNMTQQGNALVNMAMKTAAATIRRDIANNQLPQK